MDTFDIVKVDKYDDTIILAIIIEPGIVSLRIMITITIIIEPGIPEGGGRRAATWRILLNYLGPK